MAFPKSGLLLCSCSVALVILAGCQEDEIRSYRVARPEPPPSVRLLAAIFPRKDHTWFFKLVGPEKAVENASETFQTFLQSVRFTDGADKPVTWTLPEGWHEKPGAEFRYATLDLGANDTPLEVSVTRFEGKGGSLLSNIDRWRNLDLGLGPLAEGDLPKVSKELKVGDSIITLVDMTGPGARKAARKAPFADRLPAGEFVAHGARPGLKYTTPKGWKELNPRAESIPMDAAFQISEGDQTAKVTVLRTGGSLLLNVNRWRGQIGLAPTNEAQLAKDTATISIGGVSAPYVDLTGAATGKPRIVSIVISHAGQAWYFTMKGPADLVEKQKPAFEAFVKSVRFEGGKAGDE
jgi:hypothetical protein